MACKCSSMRRFGAFGDDASKLYYLDMNQRGQVRVLKDEARIALEALMSTSLVAQDRGLSDKGVSLMYLYPIAVAAISSYNLVKPLDWIAAQVKLGKKVGVANLDGRDLSIDASQFGDATNILLVSHSDEEVLAGPEMVGPNGEGPSAIGWGYTPITASNLQPGGGGGGGFIVVGPGGENPPAKPFWETPWPYAIGGAVLLGGALLLMKKRA